MILALLTLDAYTLDGLEITFKVLGGALETGFTIFFFYKEAFSAIILSGALVGLSTILWGYLLGFLIAF